MLKTAGERALGKHCTGVLRGRTKFAKGEMAGFRRQQKLVTGSHVSTETKKLTDTDPAAWSRAGRKQGTATGHAGSGDTSLRSNSLSLEA